ncbi:hypothetical protein [Thermomonas sp.]|uniref:hypothetical protein n=1 Tax=Thermomonas sp. TaxID=1971895 RepID=UPI00391A953D
MDRRKFIKSTLISGAAALPVAAGAERLYGTPGSVAATTARATEKFSLPLLRAGVPTPVIPTLSNVLGVIEDVRSSKIESDKFFQSPTAYFHEHGIDASDTTLRDESVMLLRALTNPSVQKSLEEGDYSSVIASLKSTGLLEERDPSRLESRISALLKDNIEEIRKLVTGGSCSNLTTIERKALADSLSDTGYPVSEDDIAIITQVLEAQHASLAACTAVVACAIAAIVVAYISVVIAVTVAIDLGFTIAAAVSVAVTVSDVAAPMETKAGTAGKLAKLDPVLMRDAQRAVRFSKLARNDGLTNYVVKDLISHEVRSLVLALRQNDLITVRDEEAEQVVNATTAYALRAAGLS